MNTQEELAGITDTGPLGDASEAGGKQQATQPRSADSMVPMMLATLAFVCAALAVIFCYWTYSLGSQRTEIYVIDMPAIVEMRFSELAATKETKEIIASKIADFTSKLDDKIKSMAKSGAVILSPEAVVAGREAIDVTDKVAHSVGVTMSYDAFLAQQASARRAYNQGLTGALRDAPASPSETKNAHAPVANLD